MRYNVYTSVLQTQGVRELGSFVDIQTGQMKKPKQHNARNALHETTMHPKNRYRYEKPNFQLLAEIYPSLSRYVVQKERVANDDALIFDFKDWDACRELVKVQFKHDFGITWTVSKPYLIPPIANRLNYICFIHDLLLLWSPEPRTRASYEWKILDVGCGANLVYPLLGAAYFGWSFVGCDISSDALRLAVGNRDANTSIAPLIMLRKVEKQSCQGAHDTGGGRGIIGSCVLPEDGVFDACMCNPPFFSDVNEMGQNPQTDYGGTLMEMIYPGGEEKFVTEMIQDSLGHKASVAWFSTMVGKKRTFKVAKKLLYSLGNNVIRTSELVQGVTHRWVISWSFIAPRHIQEMPLPRDLSHSL